MTPMDSSKGTEFVRHRRSTGGVEVIHRWGCGAVKNMTNPLPWNWAEGRPTSEWTGLSWFRPCARCCPDLITGPQR